MKRQAVCAPRPAHTSHTLTQEKWISFSEKRLILIPRGTEICREMSCFSMVLLWTWQGFFCLSWNEFEGNIWVFLGQIISEETAFLVLLIPMVWPFGFQWILILLVFKWFLYIVNENTLGYLQCGMCLSPYENKEMCN